MSVIITSPVVGSLKINNSSASPQSNYLCNLQTVNVDGNPFSQSVSILNELQQPIYSVSINMLTSVGASGATNFTLQNAVDAIASLIMH
jgi:hypothetical protein